MDYGNLHAAKFFEQGASAVTGKHNLGRVIFQQVKA
jgi:hypothetical protein